MEFRYDIEKFKWDDRVGEFVAYMEDLTYPGYIPFFPNRGRQFFICNKKTNNFRRFRLVLEDDKFYWFKSEDGIGCRVIKEKKIEMEMLSKIKSFIVYHYTCGYLVWLRQLLETIPG
jgi:hypothetical protein